MEEIGDHKSGLPPHLLRPGGEERGRRSVSRHRGSRRITHFPRGVFRDARSHRRRA